MRTGALLFRRPVQGPRGLLTPLKRRISDNLDTLRALAARAVNADIMAIVHNTTIAFTHGSLQRGSHFNFKNSCFQTTIIVKNKSLITTSPSV